MADPQPIPLPSNVQDLRGLTFGRLTVVDYAGRRRGADKCYHYWHCACLCGNTHVARGHGLSGGGVRSCGCVGREFNRSGDARRRHGMRHSAEYNTWCGMRQRCHNPNALSYARYGGRGIKVCERWRDSFDAFYEDMGPKPSPGHQLERVDNAGPYAPNNCRWATQTEQANNRRNNRVLTHQGESLTVMEWSRRTGIPGVVIRRRLDRYAWPVARALSAKVRVPRSPAPRLRPVAAAVPTGATRVESAIPALVPPARVPDIRGRVFGRLTVTAYAGRRRGRRARDAYHCWQCLCTCGNTHVTPGIRLRSGGVRSCGCILREYRRSGEGRRRHGMAGTPTYNVWSRMRQRCSDPRSPDYEHYGRRGIKVCERWRSFDAFYEDMGGRPSAAHQLERVANDGPYAPDNCRWATAAEQGINKRNNRILTHQGESLPVIEWARRTGIPSPLIRNRIDVLGWSVSRALSTPPRAAKKTTP
jgi:hypothetical protein